MLIVGRDAAGRVRAILLRVRCLAGEDVGALVETAVLLSGRGRQAPINFQTTCRADGRESELLSAVPSAIGLIETVRGRQLCAHMGRRSCYTHTIRRIQAKWRTADDARGTGEISKQCCNTFVP